MSEVFAYIRECTNGLQTVYQDPNDTTIREEDLKLIDVDERTTTVQFAPRSQYYAVQVTTNHLVYSLMDSSVTDNFGRSGYTGIYLICKNKFTCIDNFIDILQRILERYNHYKQMGQLHAQNYADILGDVRKEPRPSNQLTLRDSKNYYIRFNAGEYNKIEEVFHSKTPYALDKIYAFENNEQVYDDQAAQSLGLTPLTNKNVVTTQFNFDPFYLTELWINGKNYSSSLKGSSLQIVSKEELEIKGKVRDKKELISIRNNSNILPPPPPPPRVKPQQQNNATRQTSPKKNNTMYILLALGVLVGAFFGVTYIAGIFPFNDVVEEMTFETPEDSGSLQKPSFIREYPVNKTKDSTNYLTIYYFTDSISSLQNYYARPDTDDENQWFVYKDTISLKNGVKLSPIDGKNVNEALKEIPINDWNKFCDELENHNTKLKPPRRSETNVGTAPPATPSTLGGKSSKVEREGEGKTNEQTISNKMRVKQEN